MLYSISPVSGSFFADERRLRAAEIARHGLEKVNIAIGYVLLTACAPLAVAKETFFFTKHGLDEVNLVRETSWRGIVDDMAGGYVDAAQMPSGMPLWLTLGRCYSFGDRIYSTTF